MYDVELYHHGIKGQKWGVRRFQNYDGTLTAKGKARELKTAGQYKRALNRIDQGIAEEGHYYRRADAKSDRLLKKQFKLMDEQMDAMEAGNWKKASRLTNKVDKVTKKTDKALDEAIQHKKNIEKGRELSERFINEAKSKGYTVTSRKVDRLSNPGETYTASVLAGWLGTLAVAKTSEGKYYKVKKNPTYTEE